MSLTNYLIDKDMYFKRFFNRLAESFTNADFSSYLISTCRRVTASLVDAPSGVNSCLNATACTEATFMDAFYRNRSLAWDL